MTATQIAPAPQPKRAYLGPPEHTMIELHKQGFNVLPVGRPSDPKAAATSFTGRRLDPRQAIAICHRVRSGAYGVRLDGHVVVDFDEDQPDHRRFVRGRFGAPAVEVATGRGFHWYYAKPKGFDPNAARVVLSDADIRADVKSGPDQYVIGPESQRMDGVVYHPIMGDLCQSALSEINLLSDIKAANLRQSPDPLVLKGQRHDALKKHAYEVVWACLDEDEFSDNLVLFADSAFDDRTTFTDAEIHAMARWFWSKKQEGALRPREQAVSLTPHWAVDALGPDDDACALLMRLVRHHGRTRRSFRLNHESMVRAEITGMGRRKFRDARNALIRAGILTQTSDAVVGKKGCEYRLCLDQSQGGKGLISIYGPKVVQRQDSAQ